MFLRNIGSNFETFIPKKSPFGATYAFARSLLAATLCVSLALNHTSTYFTDVSGIDPLSVCSSGINPLSLYCIFSGNIELARWISVILLAIVASGFRPRIFGIVHFWLALSLQVMGSLIDGGEQIHSNLTLLLLPLTLADGRRWHWERANPIASVHSRLVLWWFVGLARLQVAIVYLFAAVGKFNVPEWVDGTALYYWVSGPNFGASSFIKSMLAPILSNAWLLALTTWSVLVLELLLFSGIFARGKVRIALLLFGIAFHIGIIFLHGIFSFAFIMVAALTIYLVPFDLDLRSFQKNEFNFFKRVKS